MESYWINPYVVYIDGEHYKGNENSFPFLGGRLIRTHSATVMSAFNSDVIKHDLIPEVDKEIIEKYELVNMWGPDDLGDRLRRYFDIPVILQVVCALASSFTPVTDQSKRLGIDEGYPCPSPQAASGCSNSFQTNLSRRRRLPATRII